MANPIKYTLATNLNTYSEDFTQGAYATSSISKTTNSVVTPFGNTNSTLITRISATANSYISKTAGISPTQRLYTLSIYAKLGNVSTNFGLRCQGSYPNRGDALFNLSTGTLIGVADGGVNTSTSGTITSVGNGWYRCSVTTTFPAATPNIYLVCSPTALGLANIPGFEGYDNALSNCYIYGAQLEKGSVATTYIATTASSVTVNATQSNSIKTSNFAIGVNKGGYGPTNITNFYNGKTPNVGGYTVYVSNGSGSPSPFVASNDAALITLSNQLGGSGITTIEAALNFFNASSTMLCTNMDYPNIVTSGLVLNLDAAYTPSFPKNGTTWKDLSGSGNNGTLVNGATYSSTDGGSILFDGTSSYVDITTSTSLELTSDLTINVWIFNTLSKSGIGIVTKGPLSGDYDYMLYLTLNSTSLNFYKKNSSGVAENGGGFITTILNTWVNVCYTKQGTSIKAYENGVLRSSSTFTDSNIRTSSNSLKIGNGWFPAFGGKIPQTQIYNRALSSTEVLQNYYAGLQRLIPTDSLVLSLDGSNTDKQVASASTAYDMSGNNNNGTLNNGVALVSDGQRSFSFDGTNDYISTNLVATWNNTNSVSISCWVKSTTTSSRPFIGTSTFAWQLKQGSSGAIASNDLQYVYWDNTGNHTNGPILTVSNFFDSVNWIHLSLVWNNTTSVTSIYKNGVLATSGTSSNPSINKVAVNPVSIGGNIYNWGAGGSYWPGSISQTQIYTRALTATEVSTIYNATKSRYGL